MGWLWDVLVLVGLWLVGAAIYLAWGLESALAYAGLALIALGVLGAWRATRA